jgi:dUTP pyrophosphatase
MGQIKVKKLPNFDKSFPLPSYETKDAAGADLRASFENKEDFTIKPGERALIPTGLSFEVQPGYEVQIRPRSGLSLKTDLLVVILGNFGKDNFTIKHGDRIAQMVLAPIHQAEFSVVDELSDTERGEGGFGSTGV